MTTPLTIRLTGPAESQIAEADAWWRRNRLAAPNAIREELARIGAIISSNPTVGPRASDVELPEVRRVHLDRIHYDVYYRVIGTPPELEIVAFWSSRRGRRPPI